ncbi:hypothetical protein [Sedimentitalea todarodis]|uniref:Uncharacterized protein n=1 Tax=Sedimentitalea todarodis TaxID=1631240 RepID=A0ABU3VBX9_9RHOB|nr:hypothetical protein [Sedimentitalea todarodis]MDU9003676.1 hypothetical protein [Sedimentitalea todarodis]
MAPRYTVFGNNPIELKTRKALRVIGGLIEAWSINPKSHPSGARTELDGRLIVFTKEAFEHSLANLPENDRLTEDDYALRENIIEIELLLRRPDRFSIVLPEPEAIEFQHTALEQDLWPTVSLPRMYSEVSWSSSDQDWPTPFAGGTASDSDAAGYVVQLDGENPLDEFLRPYLAGYCCTQCS